MNKPLEFKNLPQVSLSKLYEECNTDRQNIQSHDQIYGKSHDEGIVIKSPFYQKHEQCKGPCSCAYHRMKRYKQLSIKILHPTSNKIKDQLQLYKSRIAAAIKASNLVKKPPNELFIKPAKRIFRQTQKSSHHILQTQQLKNQKQKFKENLDAHNLQFEQILRKRMESLQDNEKVAQLVKFIKMKAKYDSSYLRGIRDYIFMRLLNVVQKVPYNYFQLYDGKEIEVQEQILKKIGAQINGKKQLAIQFFNAVRKGIQDMNNYQIQKTLRPSVQKQKSKQKQNLQQNSHSLSPSKNTITLSNKNSNTNSSKNIKISNKDVQKLKCSTENIEKQLKKSQILKNHNTNTQSINHNKIIINIHKINTKTNASQDIVIENQNNNLTNMQSNLRNRYVNSIKRTKLSTQKNSKQFSINDLNKNNEISDISQISSKKSIILKKNTSNQIRRTRLYSKLGNIQNANQQQVSFDRIQEQPIIIKKRDSRYYNQLDNSNSNQQFGKSQGRATDVSDYKKRKRSTYENRKRTNSKMKKKQNIFDTITYQQLMGKEDFQKIKTLLSQQSGLLPQNQKVRRLYKILQDCLNSQDSQSFQNFIYTFSKVLTAVQIIKLRQKKQQNSERKMIQKLTSQADAYLYKLKGFEQLIWRQQTEDDITIKKQVPSKFIDLLELQKNQGMQQQIKKFKMLQKMQDIKNVEQSVIQQKQLGQLQLHNILTYQQPIHKQLHKQKNKQNKKILNINDNLQNKSKLMQEKHRQILRYMKKYHPNMFNQVKINIKDTLQNSIHMQATNLNEKLNNT